VTLDLVVAGFRLRWFLRAPDALVLVVAQRERNDLARDLVALCVSFVHRRRVSCAPTLKTAEALGIFHSRVAHALSPARSTS
jgi:hypothetical protein